MKYPWQLLKPPYKYANTAILGAAALSRVKLNLSLIFKLNLSKFGCIN